MAMLRSDSDDLISCGDSNSIACSVRRRRQAETHIHSLATKINRLQKEIKERTGAHLDQRDELIQQRLWLQNELDNVGAG